MSEQQEHGPGTDLDVRAADEVAQAVFDAELVDETEPRPGRRVIRGTAEVVTNLGRSGPVAATGRVAQRGALQTTRGVWVAGQGGVSWARRTASAITHGHLREQIRLARIAGDREALADWTDRLEKAKDARMKRLVELPRVVLSILIAACIGTAVLWLLVLAGGVTVWASPGGLTWTDWWAGVGAVLGVLATVGQVLVAVVLGGGVPLFMLLAWQEGKRVASPPVWLLTSTERAKTPGAEVTPSKVVTALRDLGVAKLQSAIKEMGDAGAAMLGPIKIAGCGVEVDVLLPSGVSTAEVQKRRKKLAENCDRHEHELFITIPPRPRTVRLWIADSGALDEPIGPSPLVIDQDMTADVYTGRAPWGESLRGDATAISLKQRHVLITGLSNQGKTASLRALELWLALDVTTEFRIADLKGIGDWHMFQDLAKVLIEGPSDEHVIAATEMLEEGVREMERRLATLDKDKYPNGVTRELARRPGSGFHPIFLVVDEAQQAFMCPAVGEDRRPYGGTKATSRYFMAARKLHNQGRAVNVALHQGTQDPTDQNLPKLVREGAHVRMSLVVGTESQARMALGDKAVDGGAAPHLLRQGLDKGTVVTNGEGMEMEPGQSSLTVRTHFIDGDAATAVAERAKARRKRRRHLAAVAEPSAPPVDHLANIHEALRGEPRARTAVVLGRLIEQDEAIYEPWGFQDLKAALEREGASVRKFDGQSVVRADDVQRALDQRVREADGG